MPTRHLYLARHGAADAFGELTDTGRRQADLLGRRLAHLSVDAVWHSPLPRAAASAHALARHLPGVPVAPADELVDHVPHVPAPAETPPAARPPTRSSRGSRRPTSRRTTTSTRSSSRTRTRSRGWCGTRSTPRWLGLESANAALTALEYRAGLPPTLVLFNDTGHLPPELRWTGFPTTVRP